MPKCSRCVEIAWLRCYIGTKLCAGAGSARFLGDNPLTDIPEAGSLPATSHAPQTEALASPQSAALLARILASLDDDKAEDIIPIDLRGRSQMADHMVIASGRSSRQVGAIAEKLMERVKHDFGVICKVEGKETGDWVLIDAGDVIVHVFRPEVRDFYQLEKMWQSTGLHASSQV